MFIYNRKLHSYLCSLSISSDPGLTSFDGHVEWSTNPFHAIGFGNEDECLRVIDFLIDVFDFELDGWLEIDPFDEDIAQLPCTEDI